MSRLTQKIQDTKGESIAEVLIASVIAGMGMLILATMIRVSQGMIEDSNNVVNVFYEEVNQLENRSISSQDGTVIITGVKNTKSQIDVKVYKTDQSDLAMYIK